MALKEINIQREKAKLTSMFMEGYKKIIKLHEKQAEEAVGEVKLSSQFPNLSRESLEAIRKEKVAIKLSEIQKSFVEEWEIKTGFVRSISLSAPNSSQPNTFSQLNPYSTAISETIFRMPMTMIKDEDPFLSMVRTDFQNAQQVIYQVAMAQAGMAQPVAWGNPVPARQTTGFTQISVSTGLFASNVKIFGDQLTLFRDVGSMDGSYAQEAIFRAHTQVFIELFQRLRHLVVTTIANNGYLYYQDSTGTIQDFVSYGRLSENTFTPAIPWLQVSQSTGAVTYLPSVGGNKANPINDLMGWYSNPAYTIIQNTKDYLEGLAMSPETAVAVTTWAMNDNNAMGAVSFASIYKDKGFEGVINTIPSLANVNIITYDGRINYSVNTTLGYIDKTDFLIPVGIIIPLINFEGSGMGVITFTPEPNKNWLFGSGEMPSGALGPIDTRSCYMRIRSSITDTSEDNNVAYYTVEGGFRAVYSNPTAAGTSYIFNVASLTA